MMRRLSPTGALARGESGSYPMSSWRVIVELSGVLAPCALMGLGCSDGITNSGQATNAEPRLVEQAAPPPASLAALPPLSTFADAGSLAFGGDPSALVVTHAVPPGIQCSVSPEGTTGRSDPTHTSIVVADATGQIRFFPPAADWGTKLSLACGSNGTSGQVNMSVDLNDNTTFQPETVSEITPQFLRTRPPLTGDLTSLSEADLLTEGYPPRPDPANAPAQYATWVQQVSRAVDLFTPVPIAVLGLNLGFGTYQGTVNGDPWASFVQSPSGFDTSLNPEYGTFFDMYYAELLLPLNFGCQNSTSQCATSLWAGIGGRPTDYIWGTVGDGLLQSGLLMAAGPNAPVAPGTYFVAQFFGAGGVKQPAAQTYGPPPGKSASVNDQLIVWGWSSNSNACALAEGGNWGCFSFEDTTQGWGFGVNAIPAPSGTIFIPSTMDYAAEIPINYAAGGVPYNNTFYFYDTMTGGGWDSNGNFHLDPGNSYGIGDPYISTQTNTGSNECVWDATDLDFAPPNDPIYFLWQSW